MVSERPRRPQPVGGKDTIRAETCKRPWRGKPHISMLRSVGQRIPTLPIGKWSYGTCYSSKAKKLSFPVRITIPKAEEIQSAPLVTVMGYLGCCSLLWVVRFRRYREQLESPCGKADSRVRHQRAEKEGLSSLWRGLGPCHRSTECEQHGHLLRNSHSHLLRGYPWHCLK